MIKNKIIKFIIITCSLVYAGSFVNAQVYRVKGGNVLKIIQSGGNTRSENFRINAHLKPIAYPNIPKKENSSENNINNNTSNSSSGGSVPPEIKSSPPRDEGGGRHSSNWILDRKYDELVKEKESNLLASVIKDKTSFIPTDPDKVEKITDLYKKSPKLKSEKTEKVPIVLVDEKIEKNINKVGIKKQQLETNGSNFNSNEKDLEKTEISFRCLSDVSGDRMYSSAKKQSFELYEEESNCEKDNCDKIVNISSYSEKNLFTFIFGVLGLFFFIILLLIVLLAWYFYLKSKEIITSNIDVRDRELLKLLKNEIKLEQKTKKKTTKKINSLLSILFLITSFCFISDEAFAEITTPQKIIYEGELFDANGNALTGNYDFRFSLWDNQDFNINDRLMGGDLNTAATDFFGWQEIQTYNIINNGKFSIQVGTVTPFTEGLFDRINISLQIEIKKHGEPNSSYELIDLDYDNDTIDRMVIDTVPFAFNADKLDFREAGYGVGEIPYLDELGKLPSFLLPNLDAVTFNGKALGYNADEIPYQDGTGKLPNSIIPDIDAVTLDGHDSGYDPGDIPYIDETTGVIPNEIIETGITAGDIPRIEASGKLSESIIPDVEVTEVDGKALGYNADEIPYQDGTGKLPNSIIPDIDAVTLDGHDSGYDPGDIPYIDAVTGLLPVEILPGGGLGSTGTDSEVFRLDEDGDAGPIDRIRLDFGLNTGKSLAWDIGDDRFELNGDIFVDGGIETTGTINGVMIGVHDENHVLSPRYPNSIFEGDGTDNAKGYMYEEKGNVLGVEKSILRWTSKDTTMQDYDVIIRYHLVDKFDSFQALALSLEYFTEGVSSDSRLDLTVEKEGVVGDQLSGSGISLTSNVWKEETFALSGGAVWEKGDTMIIKIKMYGKNNQSSKISDIIIHTREE
ncbi:hypothetical protein [Candidatus Harpocratesius sp.]